MKVKGLIIGILTNLSHSLQLNNKQLLEQQYRLFTAMEICDLQKLETCCNNCHHCNNGRVLCDFCKGTGFLMLGDDLIGTNNVCPVCSGGGEQNCKRCCGTGKIASWKQ